MRKVKSGTIKLFEIKHIENSRMRNKDEVGDLMKDIEQRGLLEPVGIRTSDNALMYGNRRVLAFEKLGYSEIPCEFYDDVDDEELISANVAENMKRKDISSVEVGRMADLLMKKGYTKYEVAIKLNMKVDRVSTSINAYKIAYNTPFAKIITDNKSHKSKGLISEKLLWSINSAVLRTLHREVTKKEWDILIRACESEKLHTQNVSVFKSILGSTKGININQALDLLDKTKSIYTTIAVNQYEWAKVMRNEKMTSDLEFIKMLIKKYNNNLLF